MTTQNEIIEKLDLTADQTVKVKEAYEAVLKTKGDQDITLYDGTTTPNLNKRLAGIVQAVKSVNGKDGDIVLSREDLNIPTDEQLARQEKEDRFVITESGRTQRERNKDHITALDFNITSVGNETEKFNNIPVGSVIDLLGKTYTVDKYPTHIKTINGKFNNLSSERGNPQLSTEAPIVQGNYGFIAGLNTAPRLLSNKNYYPDFAKQMVVLGNNNLVNTEKAYNPISIGTNNFKDTKIVGAHNIAIGSDVMWNLASTTEWYSQNENAGTRNIGIGGNALTFLSTGYNNLAIGRNTAQCLVGGVDNVALGSNAMAGQAPVGLSGVMENCAPSNAKWCTAVGATALNRYIGYGEITAIGDKACNFMRLGGKGVAIGNQACYLAEYDVSGFGKLAIWTGVENGTYTQNGNILTLQLSNTHGATTGGRVRFRLLDGGSQTYQNDYVEVEIQSVINNVSITVNHPKEITSSGNCVLSTIYGSEDYVSQAKDFVAIGFNVASSVDDLRDSTIIGHNAVASSTGTTNRATVVGSNIGRNALGLENCTAIGRTAMYGASLYTNCTAIGHGALATSIDGTIPKTQHNSVGLGFNACVSGRDQIQLGATGTSVYAYGAVQDRSDERDKADIKPLDSKMADFILGLNAVQGVWDMRDDYVLDLFPLPEAPDEPNYVDVPKLSDSNSIAYHSAVLANNKFRSDYDVEYEIYQKLLDDRDVKIKEWWSKPEKDGTKKRVRKHNWFIAQEVKALADSLGIDFAGLQDHKLIDGTDTYTIGYEEFIPLIVDTLQKAWKRIDFIDERLSKLESK